MSNNINGFLERLTAAAGDYNKAKVGKLGYLDAVFTDVRPEVARQGQMIRIYFPDTGAFTNQAANDWSPEDVNPGYVDVPFGDRPGKAILIRDFEQFQTATDIIEQFIDPNYKRAQEYANGAVAGLITAANFNAYAPIAGTFAEVSVADAKLAWNLLVKNKVPVRDAANASLLFHPDVHANMVTDAAWNQESLVGALIARSTRQEAAEVGTESNLAFNFTRRYDQQAPVSVTVNLSGTVTNTSASVAIVGSSSKFLAETPVGSWIYFGTETVAYPVVAVKDDTHLTLGQAYVGAGGSGVTITRQTYTSVAMHKYAIALAVRPLEIVNDGHIRSRLVMIKGLPMRLMLSYQHLKAGWLMTLDYGMVAKVIRPDFGIVIQN